MHLTTYTDYSLRLLIYLGSQPNDQLTNIKEVAQLYSISSNHLSKIVFDLGKMNLIQTIRGRNGGIRLIMPPEEINLGWLIRQTEEGFTIVECFNESKNKCVISDHCRLKHVLNDALFAFINVLDQYTLKDIIIEPDLLGIGEKKA
ncbi:Rrf2 family transcriptional regulator [Bacillus sp. 2205SS5-2]|uniref:Rrf2 family transcriptional regulator n=1 Tax=Bacillus sp. 2205SS5-2 TaxID=3109031 RepID=UPI0030064C52